MPRKCRDEDGNPHTGLRLCDGCNEVFDWDAVSYDNERDKWLCPWCAERDDEND